MSSVPVYVNSSQAVCKFPNSVLVSNFADAGLIFSTEWGALTKNVYNCFAPISIICASFCRVYRRRRLAVSGCRRVLRRQC